MIAGGLAVILSFVWDYRNTMAGGLPNPFNWPLSWRVKLSRCPRFFQQ